MSLKIKQAALLVMAAVISLIAVVFGLGLAYKNFYTPKSAPGIFQFISGDGWIENGSSMSYYGLAPRGNRLELEFNPWRPQGIGPAQLQVEVCGQVATQFAVTSATKNQRVYLTGDCNPRHVIFKVLNPFTPSDTDQRALGAQLVSATITSSLSVPVVGADLIFISAGLVWLLSILVGAILSRKQVSAAFAPLAYVVVPAASLLLLMNTENLILNKLLALWLVSFSLCFGIWLGTRIEINTPKLFTWPPPRNFYSGLAVLGIVILGGALRFYGLNFGLPNNYHPDEVPKVNAIMRMVASDTLNPEYFLHPSLLLYSTYFMNIMLHWLGIPELVGLGSEFRDSAFLAGRVVSALAGTISIFFIYAIGRRLFSPLTGLMGAAMLAVLPLHVTCSRYLKEDALLTFMLLGCILTVIKAVQEEREDLLMFSGLLAGFSTGSKYSGLLAGLFVLSAPWLKSRKFVPDKEWIWKSVWALGFMPIGFFLCTPYSILTPDKFFADFSSEKRHMLRGHTIPVDAWSQFWMYHFWRSIIPGMSWVTTAFAMVGLGLLLWRRRIEDLWVVGLVLMFYIPAEWVKAKPEPQPERYIFPCLPLLALAAGEFIRVIGASRFRVVMPVLLVLAVFFPAQRSLQLASEIRYDTRTQMADWMKANLPHGSKVFFDWKPYAPRFWNNEFEVVYIPRALLMEKLDVNKLKNSGFDYLVLSSLFYERYFSQPLADASLRQRLREVFDQVPIVREIGAEHGTYGFNNPTLTLFSLKADDFSRLALEIQQKKRGELSQTSNEMRAGYRWKS